MIEIKRLKELLDKSETIGDCTKNNFWDIHHIDIVFRRDGKQIIEQGDWIKNLWYIVNVWNHQNEDKK